MTDDKAGLRRWEESVYFFLSEDHDTAFQQALQIGRRREGGRGEAGRWVQTRLAEIVTLDRIGANQTEFKVDLGSKKTTERLPFDHVFDPEGSLPLPMF
jgi:hypothetical protein